MSERTETEIKLVANSTLREADVVAALAAFPSVSLGNVRRVRQADVYLDDSAQHLARQGIGFRMRASSGRHELCWKGAQRRNGALFTREEVEREWAGKAPPRHAHELDEPLRARVEPFVYAAELEPVVALETERTSVFVRGERAKAELCVDQVETSAPHHRSRARFAEIEIELLEGDASELQAWGKHLRRAVSVTRSRSDKLRRALDHFGLGIRTDTPDLTPRSPLRDTGRAFLSHHLSCMQQQELAVRLDCSPEPVHRLRVACRRVRSALRAFADYLPEGYAKRASRAFARTAGLFGAVRDLDVLTPELGALLGEMPRPLRAGAEHALERLVDERRRLHRRAVRKLGRPRRLAELESFQCSLEDGWERAMKTRSKTTTVGKRLAHAAVHEVRDSAATGEAHVLRIALKRLRYTCEMFSGAYGDRLTRYAREIAKLQDWLGIVNDADVAELLLSDWARRAEDLRRDELLAIGTWIGHQRGRRERALSKFESAWSEFDLDRSAARLYEILDS